MEIGNRSHISVNQWEVRKLDSTKRNLELNHAKNVSE
tara:strand:- start:332 stop:442 length:111 start_codon:yes stop_codon:yes gene_type:complete